MTDTITWRREGDICAGGAVGGDWQASEAWNMRFLPCEEPDDGLHALVDENWYAERVDDPKDSDKVLGYQVTCQTTLTICTDTTDPGGTEEWTDIIYDSLAKLYDTADQAEAVAKHEAETSDPSMIGWDGRSRT